MHPSTGWEEGNTFSGIKKKSKFCRLRTRCTKWFLEHSAVGGNVYV